jgi:ribosomal protein L11 methyltransferase
LPHLEAAFPLEDLDAGSVEEALFAVGAVAVTLADAADSPILEPKPGETPLWPTVQVTALFPVDIDRAALESALALLFGDHVTTFDWRTVEDRVWEREWLKDFKPMRFGARLWVVPGGMALPAEAGTDAVTLALDPGLAFGTGTHPTTAMCLRYLDGLGDRLSGARVLDVGCGSGILAVAALRLGAARAIGVDIDPQAEIATRENAERNGVADRLVLRDATPPWPEGPYDFTLANILAGPLVELASDIAAATRPGGGVVLAGLLREQAAAVQAAYEPHFAMIEFATVDGWTCLAGRRRGI